MKTKTIQVPDDVAAELRVAAVLTEKIDKQVLVLRPGLDRALYVRCAKVLGEIGGRWSKKAGGHVFDRADIVTLLDELLGGTAVNAKKTFQAFETPNHVADIVVQRWLQAFDSPSTCCGGGFPRLYMEPSAGTGQLIRAVDRAADARSRIDHPLCQAVEIQPEVHTQLRKLVDLDTVWTFCEDFMKPVDKWESDVVVIFVDGVIMNPPFTGGQDVDHVMRAVEFLRPRGVLTAVMSPSWASKTDKRSKAFREWLTHYPSVRVEPLPEGSFKESGTNVATVTLTLINERTP